MINAIDSVTSEEVRKAVEFLRVKVDFPIQLAIVLGSGLGDLAKLVEKPITIPFEQIPFFPKSTVAGHKGQLIFGFINNVSVVVMQGRVHYYEGYTLSRITFGIRVFAAMDIHHLILTNAAGGVNTAFHPGDIMLIEDHINFLGSNPLVGNHDESWGPRFVDMSDAYSKKLRKIAEKVASENNIKMQKGVYAAMTGPSYETAAEVKMLRLLGCDAAGMSTVPECIVARQYGMDVLAMSLISNLGAGMVENDITHDEVMQIAQKSYPQLILLIEKIIYEIDQSV